MNKKLRTIVFFGNGPVAAASLEFLVQHFEIELVIQKRQKDSSASSRAIMNVAEKYPTEIPTVAAVSSKDEITEVLKSASCKSRVGVVVDFGMLIPEEAITCFELGIINSHFSLLPEWRGADPISFSILSGQPKTGVSLMRIEEGLDTGKLLVQKCLTIEPTETTPSLTHKLIELSNQLLLDYLPRYMNGDIALRSQPHPERATYSTKISKSDGLLDFNKPAAQLEREIRAYVDWPKSHTKIANREVIITKAFATENSEKSQPGTIITDKATNQLSIQTSDGQLIIEMIKPAGKKEMTAAEFLRGYGQNL